MEKASGLEDEFLRIVGGALQVSLTGEVFTGCSWGIRKLYICIGYMSGMYRVCVGNRTKGTGRVGKV